MSREPPLHIALWSPAWPLAQFQNGIITFVHYMRAELQAAGHRVSIFTRNVGEGGRERGVHLVYRRLWSRIARRIRGRIPSWEQEVFTFSRVIADEILRVHRRTPIDVLEIEESFGWCHDIARRTRIPTVVKLHGPSFLSLVEEELTTDFGRERIEREGTALRQSELIVSPAVDTLRRTIERYQLDPHRTHHIANPLAMAPDTPLWSPATCDPKCILFVGRFDQRKGADVMLRAFAIASQQCPELRLVFVGPDHGLPTASGRLLHFEDYARSTLDPSLRERIQYRGRLPNHEIARLRTQAMVTVVPSRWENQGYSYLEAMWQGCPIVCTDAGGCSEDVIHGVTGRLAHSGDPDAFAREVLALTRDPAEAARLGAAARRHVMSAHAPARVAEQSVSLYRQLIAQHLNAASRLRQSPA